MKRRGSPEELKDVLLFLAIKAQAKQVKMTLGQAACHLGWVDWELENSTPPVRSQSARVSRKLAWITKGTEQNDKLAMQPLIRKIRTGYSFADSGKAAPTCYEVLWRNWGVPFVDRLARCGCSHTQAAEENN